MDQNQECDQFYGDGEKIMGENYEDEPSFIEGIELTGHEFADGAIDFFACENSQSDTRAFESQIWGYLHDSEKNKDKTTWDIINNIAKNMRHCSTPVNMFFEAFWQIHVGYFNYKHFSKDQVKIISDAVKDFKPNTNTNLRGTKWGWNI